MQRNWQRVLIDPPEFLKQHLRLAAGIDEQKRRAVLADRLVDIGDGIARGMSCPWHALIGIENGDFRLGTAVDRHKTGHGIVAILFHQPAAQLVRLRHRCGEADGLQLRLQAAQARQPQRQKMPALGNDQRVQFVQHHVAQALEELFRTLGCDQQRKLLRRRQQNIRRRQFLSLALVRRRIAGARLDGDVETHFLDRHGEIAVNIDRKCL